MSGCFAKNGRNHFSSFGRIQVARFAIVEFATCQWVCKEHFHVSADVSSTLTEQVERLAAESKARATAVSVHDLESGLRFSLRGDRWFHAASTIKVAVLLALFRAVDEGRVRLDDSLHVRNRFFSAADGSPFQLNRDSDAMPELYKPSGEQRKFLRLRKE